MSGCERKFLDVTVSGLRNHGVKLKAPALRTAGILYAGWVGTPGGLARAGRRGRDPGTLRVVRLQHTDKNKVLLSCRATFKTKTSVTRKVWRGILSVAEPVCFFPAPIPVSAPIFVRQICIDFFSSSIRYFTLLWGFGFRSKKNSEGLLKCLRTDEKNYATRYKL